MPARLAAVRTVDPITLDGRLEEASWGSAVPIVGFTQVDPQAGEPSAFPTEVRVLFDGERLVFGFRCQDPAGRAGVRVLDLRRDFDRQQNDEIGILLDPFGDGRTAQAFEVNPLGALRDLRVADGSTEDTEWDTVWDARIAWTEEGWTAEIALPWTSLRYPEGATRWRVNFLRRVRRANEVSGWVPWSRAYGPYRMSFAGELVGLEPPAPGHQLRLQPYLLGRREERRGESPVRTDDGFELGGEAKWVPSPNTVIDATVNTDFAQAEVDRQVVNLGRFSVFFPEKRQFFLESAGLFDSTFDDFKPFFSRRIGLDEAGRPVPIRGGLRLVHQDARQSWGGLLVRTGETAAEPASTFGLARYSRNVGERNRLGGSIVTRFDERLGERPSTENLVVSLDGLYRPAETFTVQGVLAGSSTRGRGAESDGLGGSVWAYFENDWIYAGLVEQFADADFDPRAGFLLRNDLLTTSPAVTLDLRPAWLPKGVRSLKPNVVGYWYHRFETLELEDGWLRLEPLWVVFDSGAEVFGWVEPTWQRLRAPFEPVAGLEVAPGSYDGTRWGLAAATDRSRWASLEVRRVDGDFYDGRLAQWIVKGRLAPSPRLALSLSAERNELTDVGRPGTRRTTELIAPELRAALDPRLQLALFYQYNTDAERASWNARLAWEVRPLSFLYLVWARQEPTDPRGGFLGRPDQTDEQLLLKLVWTFQR